MKKRTEHKYSITGRVKKTKYWSFYKKQLIEQILKMIRLWNKTPKINEKEVNNRWTKKCKVGIEKKQMIFSIPTIILLIQFILRLIRFILCLEREQNDVRRELRFFCVNFYTPLRSKGGVYSSFALLFSCIYPCTSPSSMAVSKTLLYS